MNNLLDFLQKYNYLLLFLLLEIAGLALLFRFNNYHGSVWFSGANNTVARINGLYTEAVDFVHLKEVNSKLTAQNVALQMEADILRDALAEARRDTLLTERLMRERLSAYHLIPARVVGNSVERANNYLVINRGSRDGVKAEMGVVGGSGVVGIVYLTGPDHSLVIPVTNRKSSISCRIRGQNYFGFLQWDGSSMRTAFLDDVPRYAKVRINQAVETSGYSAVFPPGLFVGRINKIGNSPDGQSFRLNVTLGTDFASLRDVQVIATEYKAEIDTLKAQAAAADDPKLR